MNRRNNRLLWLPFLLLLLGCEEVVEVDLEESEPRLVIEASLIWNLDSEDLPLYIRISETAPYFSDEMPPAVGALVSVSTESGEEYNFEEAEPGVYYHAGFVPLLEEDYVLEVEYEEEFYTATERLYSVPELEFVEQTDNGGFGGEDAEFKVFYTDPGQEENFYLFRFYHEKVSLQIYDDEFTNGNRTFAFFSEDEVQSGDQVLFEIQGISRRFFEYMYILRSQAGTSGGPFQTPPTSVRGNIINTSTPENYAYGYFRLSYSDYLSYQVK